MMKDIFKELYDQYHRDLYQFIFYMVKDKHLTEDLVQEVYIKVIQSYDSFQGNSSQKTWLFSIARHVTIDYFRKHGRRKKHINTKVNLDESNDFISDQQPLPQEIVERKESVQQLYHFIDECTEDQKMVIILRYIQELSIKETAEVLNWTTSKVKTTQHRGINLLKEKMNKVKEGDGNGEL
ncbi:RNA polymerase sigma factor SigX [Bacillaceae bacterium W0354]